MKVRSSLEPPRMYRTGRKVSLQAMLLFSYEKLQNMSVIVTSRQAEIEIRLVSAYLVYNKRRYTKMSLF